MKKIMRYFLFNLAALYFIEKYVGGVSYSGDYRVLAMAAGALTVALVVIRPIVKVVTLPINIVTLGLFGSFINAGLLYGVTFVVPKFTINPFSFEGLGYKGMAIPGFSVGVIGAVVVVAFVLSLVTTVLSWLTD
ncbi:MAG: phage holin family protein [bacterium]